MTSGFLTEDFLLHSPMARTLFHDHAKDLPIYDYHCHIPVNEIAEDKNFENITRIWLNGDHYKWRAMRTNGVDERFITGNATDREKFEAWAATVPATLRNPLYHWTHLELRRFFGVQELLDAHSAGSVYERCSSMLQEPELSTRGILKKMNVRLVCTTDDPLDDLKHHRGMYEEEFSIKVYPAFRPDMGMAVERPEDFNAWVDRLEAVSGKSLGTFTEYLGAIRGRHDFFHRWGCRLSDHGIDEPYAAAYTDAEIEAIFDRARGRRELTEEGILKFKSCMLYEFALMDHERGWAQQYHFGALRSANSRLHAQLGRDCGFDSIGDFEMARPLARFLDRLDAQDKLAPTILYNVNPQDNEVMATMTGNFMDGSKPGKMQFGSGWWFLDQKDGMTRQLEALSNMGLLSRFVGMLTDSRCFLSYPRHEYFRRVLCNLLGEDVERGELPDDEELLGGMVEDICWNNAKNYFGMEV